MDIPKTHLSSKIIAAHTPERSFSTAGSQPQTPDRWRTGNLFTFKNHAQII